MRGSNEQLQQQLEGTLLKPNCEDTLEERYAIKFCFKLGKKMLPQKRMECCRLLFDHLAWIEHQFLSSLRDSRKPGSLWEMMRDLGGVRKSEHQSFMDKDRRMSIETISAQFDVLVGNVTTIIREEPKIRKICAKFVPRVLREDQKERRCHDSKEKVELINSDPAVLDALVTCDESWIYCYDTETKRHSSQWKHAGSSRPKKARQSKSTQKLFWQNWHDLHALGSHWTDSQQGMLYWGFKRAQEEIPSEVASTLQIGSVTFPPGQCTSP